MRKIVLSGEINEVTVIPVIEKILEFNDTDSENEEVIKDYEREQIDLYIDTYGGEAYSAFPLYDIIKNSKTPIRTIGLKAMSAGLAILMAGHIKTMTANSSILYHEIRGTTYGKVSNQKSDILVMEHLQKVYDDIIIKNSKITPETLNKHKQHDWIIFTTEALELGLIDYVLGANNE